MSGLLIRFPTREEAPKTNSTSDVLPTPATSPQKVVLHDGALTLYQRDSVKGTWQYKLRLPDCTDERKSTGERDFTKATKIAEDRFRDVRHKQERGLSIRVSTFDTAAASYAKHLRREAKLNGTVVDKGTEKKIRLMDTFLVAHFHNTPLLKIDARAVAGFHDQHLANWEEALNDTRTIMRKCKQRDGSVKEFEVKQPNRSIKRPGVNGRAFYDQMIKAVFEHAVKQGLIARAEVPEFEATRPERRRRGGFTAAEEARLLGHLEDRITTTPAAHHQSSRRMLWLWTRFHLLTGLRPGKESELRFADVEFKDGTKPHYVVHVRQGKTGSRPVVADAHLGMVLDGLRAQHPSPTPDAPLWIKPCGTHSTSYSDALLMVLRELGMEKDATGKKRTAYSLRHTAISRSLDRGRNIHMVAKNCGTSVQMIAKHYDDVLHELQAHELLK